MKIVAEILRYIDNSVVGKLMIFMKMFWIILEMIVNEWYKNNF
jgi:hypothetical protein